MNLAISNIAWPIAQDDAIADLLNDRGIAGIEIAPTKIWPLPLEVTDRELDAYRATWEARGIRIVSAQALLFGRPELKLFEGAEVRRRTLDYLRGIIRLCARLGAGALVFGSPANRAVGSADRETAWRIAVDFFGTLGEYAAEHGAAVVIEALPAQYASDFIMRAEEAIALVRAVNHPGFRLHLDVASMAAAGDDPQATLGSGATLLRHFHISEPNLAPILADTIYHRQLAEELGQVGYPHWCAIETRESNPFTLAGIASSLDRAIACYGRRSLSNGAR